MCCKVKTAYKFCASSLELCKCFKHTPIFYDLKEAHEGLPLSSLASTLDSAKRLGVQALASCHGSHNPGKRKNIAKQDSFFFFINETWCESESLYTRALVWGSPAHSAPSLSMNEACGGVLQARWMGQLSSDGCQALPRVTQRGGLELRPLTSKLGSVLDVTRAMPLREAHALQLSISP